MKLLTYSTRETNAQLGVLIDEKVYAVNELDSSLPNQMEDFIQQSEENLTTLQKAYNNATSINGFDLENVNLHAPIRKPGSVRDFMAFEEHLVNAYKRSGMKIPDDWYKIPAFYFTNHRTIQGPNETIERPQSCKMLDFELEVAIIIGKEGKNISAEDADDYIFGYMILNDWSARDLQLKEMSIGLGPAKGKDFATSIGPYIVTKEELEETRDNKGFNLKMTSSINGKKLSDGNLNSIYYSFNEMIEHASQNSILYPGDIIGSGTVGTGCILEHGPDVQTWLADGDEVTLAVEKLGSLTNKIGK